MNRRPSVSDDATRPNMEEIISRAQQNMWSSMNIAKYKESYKANVGKKVKFSDNARTNANATRSVEVRSQPDNTRTNPNKTGPHKSATKRKATTYYTPKIRTGPQLYSTVSRIPCNEHGVFLNRIVIPCPFCSKKTFKSQKACYSHYKARHAEKYGPLAVHATESNNDTDDDDENDAMRTKKRKRIAKENKHSQFPNQNVNNDKSNDVNKTNALLTRKRKRSVYVEKNTSDSSDTDTESDITRERNDEINIPSDDAENKKTRKRKRWVRVIENDSSSNVSDSDSDVTSERNEEEFSAVNNMREQVNSKTIDNDSIPTRDTMSYDDNDDSGSDQALDQQDRIKYILYDFAKECLEHKKEKKKKRKSDDDRHLFVYKCKECLAHFLKPFDLVKHTQLGEHSIDTFDCTTCSLTFPISSKLKHLKMHESKGNVQVKVFAESDTSRDDNTDANAQSQSTAEVAVPGPSNKDNEEQTVPQETANTLNGKNLPRPKLYQCVKCKVNFFSMYKLNSHLNQSSHRIKTKKFVCVIDKCKLKFNTFAMLLEHDNIEHDSCNDFEIVHKSYEWNEKNQSDNQLYRCEGCDIHFLAYYSLMRHLSQCHKKAPQSRAECDICKVSFTKKSLTLHKEKHSELRLFNKEDFTVISYKPKFMDRNNVPHSDTETTSTLNENNPSSVNVQTSAANENDTNTSNSEETEPLRNENSEIPTIVQNKVPDSENSKETAQDNTEKDDETCIDQPNTDPRSLEQNSNKNVPETCSANNLTIESDMTVDSTNDTQGIQIESNLKSTNTNQVGRPSKGNECPNYKITNPSSLSNREKFDTQTNSETRDQVIPKMEECDTTSEIGSDVHLELSDAIKQEIKYEPSEIKIEKELDTTTDTESILQNQSKGNECSNYKITKPSSLSNREKSDTQTNSETRDQVFPKIEECDTTSEIGSDVHSELSDAIKYEPSEIKIEKDWDTTTDTESFLQDYTEQKIKTEDCDSSTESQNTEIKTELCEDVKLEIKEENEIEIKNECDIKIEEPDIEELARNKQRTLFENSAKTIQDNIECNNQECDTSNLNNDQEIDVELPIIIQEIKTENNYSQEYDTSIVHHEQAKDIQDVKTESKDIKNENESNANSEFKAEIKNEDEDSQAALKLQENESEDSDDDVICIETDALQPLYKIIKSVAIHEIKAEVEDDVPYNIAENEPNQNTTNGTNTESQSEIVDLIDDSDDDDVEITAYTIKDEQIEIID